MLGTETGHATNIRLPRRMFDSGLFHTAINCRNATRVAFALIGWAILPSKNFMEVVLMRLSVLCLAALLCVFMLPLVAEAGCYGCDQMATCQPREAGTLGLTGCIAYTLNGNYYCELSGSSCSGGSGGCCKQKDVFFQRFAPVWRLAAVTTWSPLPREEWVLRAAVTSSSVLSRS